MSVPSLRPLFIEVTHRAKGNRDPTSSTVHTDTVYQVTLVCGVACGDDCCPLLAAQYLAAVDGRHELSPIDSLDRHPRQAQPPSRLDGMEGGAGVTEGGS